MSDEKQASSNKVPVITDHANLVVRDYFAPDPEQHSDSVCAVTDKLAANGEK